RCDETAQRLMTEWTSLMRELLAAQRPYDNLDPLLLASASIEAGSLRIGEADYQVVVLPSVTNLERVAWTRLEELVATGGTVVACGALPSEDIEPASDVIGRCHAAYGDEVGREPAFVGEGRREAAIDAAGGHAAGSGDGGRREAGSGGGGRCEAGSGGGRREAGAGDGGWREAGSGDGGRRGRHAPGPGDGSDGATRDLVGRRQHPPPAARLSAPRQPPAAGHPRDEPPVNCFPGFYERVSS